jgi:hypothetical protein
MEGGKSSANSYWPGFVDALTNVVIAMIFVVVVLAISLSFAAQQMGKKLAEEYIKKMQDAQPASVPAVAAAPDAVPPPSAQKSDVRIAVASPPKASAPSTATVRNSSGRLQLDYPPDAFVLDSASQARLLESLAAASPTRPRRVELVAVGPDMSLSDNQRGAYVRLMAVRNALIEAGYTADQILTRIDTTQSPPAASVFVVLPE